MRTPHPLHNLYYARNVANIIYPGEEFKPMRDLSDSLIVQHFASEGHGSLSFELPVSSPALAALPM